MNFHSSKKQVGVKLEQLFGTTFSYETGNGIHRSEQGNTFEVVGGWSYEAPNGEVRYE